MVNLTIDDKQVSVPEGTTILKAAQSVDIEIPTLCYHPKLSPIGACRVCVVEVEGEDRPVASCDTQAREGMIVRTNTDEIVRQRKQMIQFMLLHHPLDCPVCDKSAECEVQDLTVAMGILEQQFSSAKPEKTKEELSPTLDLWHSRCVMCGRCVQVCKEIQGARAIDYVVRSGFTSKVGPTEGDGYPCESCSQCLSVCPVGAILDSTFLYAARAWQLDKVNSVCTFCGVGCSYELNVRDNRVYRVTVGDFQGHNRGNLCSVGRFGRDLVHSESRLVSPAIRNNGDLGTVGWDDALDHVARRLKEIVGSEGGRSVAGLASAHCSNEALFAFQRLMREGVGTDRIDTLASLSNHALIDTMTDVHGVPAPTGTLADMDDADAILIVDSNIVCTHPVTALEALRVFHSGSAKVFVVGHRSNKLTTQCTQFARTMPGSEVALLNCLANLVIDRAGLGEGALPQGVDGFDKLKLHVSKYTLKDVAASTGIDESVISEIADGIAGAGKFVLIASPGSLHSAINPAIMRAGANLATLKGGKILSLLREGNAQGAIDMGASPEFLPGYKEGSGAQSGLSGVVEIFQALEAGELKGLYLMGGDIRKELALLGLSTDALQTLDFLVVQDILGSPVSEMAHALLPACSSAERDATYTNAYRMMQRAPAVIKPLGDCLDDTEILNSLSQKLGLPALSSVEAVREHIASTVEIYGSLAGLSGDGNGAVWDINKLGSPDGKVKLSTIEEAPAGSDAEHPYVLVFDNTLHYGGEASRHSASLAKTLLDGVIEVSDADAGSLGVKDGETVEVTVKGCGSAQLPVHVSKELPTGVVSVPAHSYESITSLVSKIEPSALRSDGRAPVWLASVKPAKS